LEIAVGKRHEKKVFQISGDITAFVIGGGKI